MIEWIKKIYARFRKGIYLLSISKKERRLISSVKENRLTYLSDRRLISIVKTCRELKKKKISGIFIEAGCALGGSAIIISSIKEDRRKFKIYDVFGMIPPPTENDPQEVHERFEVIKKGESSGINGDEYYGYKENLYDLVKKNLKDFNIDPQKQNLLLAKGLVQENLKVEEQVAFAHIDVDFYEPVKICLERITPHLVTGGTLILDDYQDWGGCKKAVDECFKKADGKFSFNVEAGSLKIIKMS